MIAPALQRELPLVIPFPTLHKAAEDAEFLSGEVITLRSYWTRRLLPDLQKAIKDGEFSERSLAEDRHALNAWERETRNPDIRDVTPRDLEQLKEGLLARGNSPATVNKRWRELKGIFSAAVYEQIIPRPPQIAHRRASRLMKEPPKRQREALSESEVAKLWRQASEATYPTRTQFPAPHLWRVWIVLQFMYGPRTVDLRKLRWEDVLFSDRMIKFEAQKTKKVQGLPLTDVVVKHLKSIHGHSERVFPGFNSAGSYLKKEARWKPGFYSTWRSEITDGMTPFIWIKHFRESMVTRYNGVEPGLGSWIAGHYVPGVTAQSYDFPTKRIRDAIESTTVPHCFAEVG